MQSSLNTHARDSVSPTTQFNAFPTFIILIVGNDSQRLQILNEIRRPLCLWSWQPVLQAAANATRIDILHATSVNTYSHVDLIIVADQIDNIRTIKGVPSLSGKFVLSGPTDKDPIIIVAEHLIEKRTDGTIELEDDPPHVEVAKSVPSVDVKATVKATAEITVKATVETSKPVPCKNPQAMQFAELCIIAGNIVDHLDNIEFVTSTVITAEQCVIDAVGEGSIVMFFEEMSCVSAQTLSVSTKNGFVVSCRIVVLPTVD